MTAPHVTPAAWAQRMRLRLELWIWREGWIWSLLATVLVTTTLLWTFGLKPAQDRQRALEQALTEARKPAQRPVGTGATAWAALDQALQQTSPPETLLKRWTAYARQRDLHWQGATLQMDGTKLAGLQKLQVEVTLRGRYVSWRGFAQDLLNDNPSTALASVELSDAAAAGGTGNELLIKVRVLVWRQSNLAKGSP